MNTFHPCHCWQIKNPRSTQELAVEIDLEPRSTTWGHHSWWFCNSIINVKRESSYGKRVSFPFSEWWYDTVGSLSPAVHPIQSLWIISSLTWSALWQTHQTRLHSCSKGIFTSLWDIFNLLVSLVTWISQRVAVALPVIIEQASSSEALIWKWIDPGCHYRPRGNSHMALDPVKITSMDIKTHYCSWTCKLS